MKTIKTKILAFVSLLAVALGANANGFSNIYVFGDSLSDNGNLNALQPEAPERFTNGPVAAEVVAAQLGFALTPSFHLSGTVLGNNFAIAGAKAVDDDGDETTPDINLPTQVNAFLQSVAGQAPSDALYIVLIGGNDIRDARAIRAEGALADTTYESFVKRIEAKLSIKNAAQAEVDQIAKLVAAGAQNILVVNAPDIGAIPETDAVTALTVSQADNAREERKAARLPKVASKLSAKFNRILARKVAKLERNSHFNLIEYDLFDFLSGQIENAEDFGYTNTDTSCISILTGFSINPDCVDFPTATGFLFWDEIHPTTVAHQAAGVEILQTILTQ